MNPEDAREPVIIKTYDADWRQVFEREARMLRQVLAPYAISGIEHVGSTAIVGMTAKPVVEIMVGTMIRPRSRIVTIRFGRLLDTNGGTKTMMRTDGCSSSSVTRKERVWRTFTSFRSKAPFGARRLNFGTHYEPIRSLSKNIVH
ncbi:MAG: GrpB family protein [Candidatus Eremiobacteraeota bacterium]|nr:GrpB family protein [Candidatus Eremiobacteraeota bacterium]